METIHEGLVILTPDLKVREINQAAEWMLGYGSAEIVGLSAENILIGAERLLAALENALKGLSSHNLLNTSLHRRNGQVFPVRIQVIPVNRENGIEAVVVVIEDASEKEQIRLRSEQLEHRALLGEVTAVFAHEVRNPINNISAGLQLLASQFPEDHAGQDTINRMQNDCQRLNHLMESVLSFSRPNELKLAPLDICAFADNLIKRWAPRFSRVHVTPFTQFGENAPKVLGDPRALEQVFTNLFNNALEAMNKNGGTLGVRIALDTTIPNNHQVTITVSDSGPGIPEEIREKIFEPFVTTNKKGTGLGLAITKNIITAHRGSIRVNSFPGGTVFLIHLPVYYGDRA
jgi:PAS domain S-box-containing protein